MPMLSQAPSKSRSSSSNQSLASTASSPLAALAGSWLPGPGGADDYSGSRVFGGMLGMLGYRFGFGFQGLGG